MRKIVKDKKRLSAIISEMIGDGNNFALFYYLKMGVVANSHKNFNTLII